VPPKKQFPRSALYARCARDDSAGSFLRRDKANSTSNLEDAKTQQTQQWFTVPSDQLQSPRPHFTGWSAIGDPMAAAAKYDRLWGTAPATFRPIVMPRQTAPAATPLAGSRTHPSRVARSDIVLPFPIRMWSVDRLLMTRTHRVRADIAHSVSSAGNAATPRSERKIAN
jgi:hypothetical protein